jgi:adenine-specific DNA-methyltransferase
VSFNNEGYITAAEMVRLLSAKGHVVQLDVDFRRYVGAQIGIHNPAGEKVGRISHVRNTEHLFLVGERDAVEEAAHAMPPQRHAHAVTGRAPMHALTKPGG